MFSKAVVNMWWSFIWRASVYGFGIGFVMGAVHGALVGTPTAGFLLLVQLVAIVVAGLFAMKHAMQKNNISVD